MEEYRNQRAICFLVSEGTIVAPIFDYEVMIGVMPGKRIWLLTTFGSWRMHPHVCLRKESTGVKLVDY